MLEMKKLFASRLQSGLTRKSVTDPGKWAEQYRVMSHPYPGLWSFKHHPWLREMHNAKGELCVGQKAAQVGYTEFLLNKVFYTIDVPKLDVLYVLPSKIPDATDFSSARFDKALELSDHLARLFSDVNNVGHKKAGGVNLYIRGSNSRSQLKSIPVSLVCFDEVDEMEQENITLALERTSGQLIKEAWMISTPRIEGKGINKWFKQTTQEHFFFPCPSCSRMIELKYPESLVVLGDGINDPRVKDSYLQCYECKGKLHHQAKEEYLTKGVWEVTQKNVTPRGFYVNQMYSPTVEPAAIASAVHKAKINEFEEQELYNSKMGLTHTTAGSKITDYMIDLCIGSFKTKEKLNRSITTMGVDVGKVLHVEIDNWILGKNETDINEDSIPRVVLETTVREFEELDRLMRDFQVLFAVVDCQPETRKAREFARRFWGHVRLCRYNDNIIAKEIKTTTDEELTIQVHRTSWLDVALGRFRRGLDGIRLPIDCSNDYKEQIKAQARVPGKDRNGNPIVRYETPDGVSDHFAHARTYAEIALPLAVDIRNPSNSMKIL